MLNWFFINNWRLLTDPPRKPWRHSINHNSFVTCFYKSLKNLQLKSRTQKFLSRTGVGWKTKEHLQLNFGNRYESFLLKNKTWRASNSWKRGRTHNWGSGSCPKVKRTEKETFWWMAHNIHTHTRTHADSTHTLKPTNKRSHPSQNSSIKGGGGAGGGGGGFHIRTQ